MFIQSTPLTPPAVCGATTPTPCRRAAGVLCVGVGVLTHSTHTSSQHSSVHRGMDWLAVTCVHFSLFLFISLFISISLSLSFFLSVCQSLPSPLSVWTQIVRFNLFCSFFLSLYAYVSLFMSINSVWIRIYTYYR